MRYHALQLLVKCTILYETEELHEAQISIYDI